MRALVGKGKIHANHVIYRKLWPRMGFACLVFMVGLFPMFLMVWQGEAKVNWLA